MAQTLFSTLSGEATLDEEDIFQCGKCKDQFTSFTEFFIHKKTAHGTVSLENVSKVDETSGLMYSEIVPDQGFTQPITLTDSEFLSLSMDQGPLNITASPQVLDCCEAYLTTTTTTEATAATAVATDPDQTAFQVPVTVHPEEVILSTNSEVLTEEAKEIAGTNTITVSVVGAVHDQISSDVRNDAISKDTDTIPGGKMKCMYCPKAFTKNFDLQQHVRSHTGERPFQCVVCGRAFSQKSNVKKHMTTHKVWPKRLKTLVTEAVSPTSRIIKETSSKNQTQNSENGNIADQLITKAYSCQYCPEIFNNYFELKSHRKAHIHQKVYRCIQKNCSEAFSDLDCFLGHTINHQSEAQYHCHVCNKEFKSLDDLGTHQYSHNVPTNKFTPRVVSCKKCKCKFANLEALERHMALDSHTYPCPQCQKVFACERFLRRHLLTHSTVLPYVCEHCNKAFKTVQYLSTHSVIHSNEKPFACQHCPAAFNRSDKLSRHVLIHENLRKYKCPFSKHLGCTKAFNRKDQLKAHMMTHSATLKHSCTGCNHIFQKQAQLKQHEKTCRSFLLKSSFTRAGVIDNSAKPEKDNAEITNDQNMSTIEIVVVPVKKKIMATNGRIRITCPTSTTGNPVDLSQAIIVPDQEVPNVSTNNS